MLKQRIITALVLLPIVIWTIFLAPVGVPAFPVFAGAVVLVGGWEWARIMGWSSTPVRLAYAGLVALGLAAIQLPGMVEWRQLLYLLSAFWWLIALRLVVAYPENTALWARPALMLPMGLLLLLPAWLGLTDLHQQSPWWLMYVFGLVWGADTGAYFAGRAFGKRKLAPDVSPGKTIEGMIGGLLLTGVLMVATGLYRGLEGQRLAAFLALSFLTVLASVLGDLFESMAKRHCGIKDSGSIFPGHGGALDRIDSLTAAAPVFMAGWWLAGGF